MAAVLWEAAGRAPREPVAAIPLPQLATHGHDPAEAFGRGQVLRTILGAGRLVESFLGTLGNAPGLTLGNALGALAPVAGHHSHANYVVDRGSCWPPRCPAATASGGLATARRLR
jgi:hypothetical protein